MYYFRGLIAGTLVDSYEVSDHFYKSEFNLLDEDGMTLHINRGICINSIHMNKRHKLYVEISEDEFNESLEYTMEKLGINNNKLRFKFS